MCRASSPSSTCRSPPATTVACWPCSPISRRRNEPGLRGLPRLRDLGEELIGRADPTDMETLNRRPVAGGELTDAPIRPRAFLARLLPLSADLRPVYARLLAVVVAALSLLVACITAEELLGIGVSGTGLAVRHGCEAAA